MNGKLVVIIGPSGAGKDTLIAGAREILSGSGEFMFAHRYITRPADSGSENHIALTTEEFAIRQSAGFFALHWHGNGLSYGIGTEINSWLDKGMTVVLNGSRAFLASHDSLPDHWIPVAVTVDRSVLKKRLLARKRESAEVIESRLTRNDFLNDSIQGCCFVNNDCSISEGVDKLVSILTKIAGGSPCA